MKNKNYRKITSIVIGTIYAFILSVFFILFQDILYALELDRISRSYYPFAIYDSSFDLKFTFSYISAILGIHYALQHYYSSDFKTRHYKNHKRFIQSIFMTWVILFCLAKGAWLISLYSGVLINQIQVRQEYSSLNILGYGLLLFISVYSINNYKNQFPKTKSKLILISILTILTFSYILSSIDFIDRRKLEKIELKNHPYSNQYFDLPQSEYSKPLYYKKSVENYFFFSLVRNKKTKVAELFYKNKSIPIKEIGSTILTNRNETINLNKYILSIDKTLKVSDVIPYLFVFYSHQIYNVGFQVQTEYINQPSIITFKLHHGIFYDFEHNNPRLISQKDSIFLEFPLHFNNYIKDRAKTQLSLTQNGILFKDSILSKHQLNNLVEQTLKTTIDSNWKLEVLNDYSQDFQTYISNKSLIFNALNKQRETYAEKTFGIPYKRLSKFQQKIIKGKFPLAIYEIGLSNIAKQPIEFTAPK